MRWALSLAGLICAFLEKDGPFVVPSDADGEQYHGLGLPREVLEKVYRANFERVCGIGCERQAGITGFSQSMLFPDEVLLTLWPRRSSDSVTFCLNDYKCF